MTKPVIAVTSGKKQDQPDWRAQYSYWAGCPVDYPNALLQSGGAPVLIPYTADRESVRSIILKADGLLLTGGRDVDPSLYKQHPHPKTSHPDHRRDQMELAAIAAAMDMGLPILAICRGMQVLNVALGGTLIQHLPDLSDGRSDHDLGGRIPNTHQIKVVPESLLADVLGAQRLTVNSRHHQAVDTLGAGLRISARAEDGVVEAVELDDSRQILAVQFHPENILDPLPILRKLFDWLVNKGKKRLTV